MRRSQKRKRNRTGNVIEYRTTKYCVIYIRLSYEEQARDGFGPQSQEFKCRELCAERGWTVLKVFVDLVSPAGQMLNGLNSTR